MLFAGLILVMLILPSQFGVDPLGTGARVGLRDFGVTGQQVAALEQAAAAGSEQAAILILPQERSSTPTRLSSKSARVKVRNTSSGSPSLHGIVPE